MESPYKGKTGLRRVWSALFYSLAGLRAAIRHEDAFRQEVLLAGILIPTALFLPASAIGKALMIASVLLVLIVELLNSAVEAAVDHFAGSSPACQARQGYRQCGGAAEFAVCRFGLDTDPAELTC